MVELQATTAHGTVSLVGVAVAEGGVVATTADVLRGVQRVVMIGPDGKAEPASVMASDSSSDIALVNVPEDLPVAPFTDDSALDSGAPVLTLSYVPAGGREIALHCTPGSVTAVGAAIAEGPAGGMPSITSSVPAPTVTGRPAAAHGVGSGVGDPLRPRPAQHPRRHLPPQRSRRGRGRRPPLARPRRARVARTSRAPTRRTGVGPRSRPWRPTARRPTGWCRATSSWR